VIDRQTVVTHWAERWRTIRAWGRPLEEVAVAVRERKERVGSTGSAWPQRRGMVVRAGADMPDALETILHEYAHLAVSGAEHHGEEWSAMLAAAVLEVTGIAISTDGTKSVTDHAATDALRVWWRVTGHEFAWGLLQKRARLRRQSAP